MDISIQKLLGIADDAKRMYRFAEGEVEREEFEYCQLIDQLVFGDKGYVETLGQTWEMIHDPRFLKIEGAFIVNRKAVFGGDAKLGKQYMSSDGMFVSTIADLEEYSEVLGEGRYFWLVLSHPGEDCPVRLWHERIYPGVLAARKKEAPPAGGLACTCLEAVEMGLEGGCKCGPEDLKDAPDEALWALIKQECPNYFDQAGKPNGMAKRLLGLFRADLVGLIADYSPTPLVDVYVELDTGDVVHDNEYSRDPMERPPLVFLEVDILEKALTYRATMRATAAKILRSLGIQSQLKALGGGDPRLTDEDRDNLLRMVYQSDWPDDKPGLITKLISYISALTRIPFEAREKEQLSSASEWALRYCNALQTGEEQPINSYTEPQVEVQADPHAAVMEAILHNPLKQELFIIWANAERLGQESKVERVRLDMRQLYSILTPVFTDPAFVVDDEKFWEYMNQAKRLGYYDPGTVSASMEGDLVPDEDAFLANRRLREARGEKRTPVPSEEGPSGQPEGGRTFERLDKIDAIIKEAEGPPADSAPALQNVQETGNAPQTPMEKHDPGFGPNSDDK